MSYTWQPKLRDYNDSEIYLLMQHLGLETVNDLRDWAVANKEAFWTHTIQTLEIVFKKPYDQIFSYIPEKNYTQWLEGASLNIIDSCFNSQPDKVVVKEINEIGEKRQLIQKELETNVNRIANGLTALGVNKGDVIAVVMPMHIEAVQLYLAAIKAGLKVVTIADSFSSEEIQKRIELTQPVLICTQDCFIRNSKTHELSVKIPVHSSYRKVVLKIGKKPLNEDEITYQSLLTNGSFFESISCRPDDVMTILFSSGTTGTPKAIPWTHTTPIKAASDGLYHHVIREGEVVCWPTNLGWMMGPWLIFAGLINKGCLAIYNGAPTTKGFIDFVETSAVSVLGLVPTLVKHWRNKKLIKPNTWTNVKRFSSTGEVSNAEDMAYLMKTTGGKPIIEYCGGTEIGGGYISSTIMEENKPSKFSGPTIGTSIHVLNDNQKPASKGAVFIEPPVLGLSETLLNADHQKVYFEDTPIYNGLKLRKHGDHIEQTTDGYYLIRGRLDDTMNLGGIKISAVEIEKVVNQLNFVKESAAIAYVPDGGGADLLVLFYVGESAQEEEAIVLVQNQIKKKLNPLFKVFDLIKIDKLPRTASNKVMRKNLKQSYSNSNR